MGGVASGQSRRLKAVNGAPTPQPPLPEVLAELDRKVAGTLLAHEWRTDGVRPATIGFG